MSNEKAEPLNIGRHRSQGNLFPYDMAPPSEFDLRTTESDARSPRGEWDTRRYPLCPPFFGAKGRGFELFEERFTAGLASEGDEYASLEDTLYGIDPGGDAANAPPLGGAAAHVRARLKRRRDLFRHLYRHVENADLRQMASALGKDGREFWLLLERECREAKTDLELLTMDSQWADCTIANTVGQVPDSITRFSRHLQRLNGLRPAANRKTLNEQSIKFLQAVSKVSIFALRSLEELQAQGDSRRFKYPAAHAHAGERDYGSLVSHYDELWRAAYADGLIAKQLPSGSGLGARDTTIGAHAPQAACVGDVFQTSDAADHLVCQAVEGAHLVRREDGSESEIVCYNCCGLGHTQDKCPSSQRRRSFRVAIQILSALVASRAESAGGGAARRRAPWRGVTHTPQGGAPASTSVPRRVDRAGTSARAGSGGRAQARFTSPEDGVDESGSSDASDNDESRGGPSGGGDRGSDVSPLAHRGASSAARTPVADVSAASVLSWDDPCFDGSCDIGARCVSHETLNGGDAETVGCSGSTDGSTCATRPQTLVPYSTCETEVTSVPISWALDCANMDSYDSEVAALCAREHAAEVITACALGKLVRRVVWCYVGWQRSGAMECAVSAIRSHLECMARSRQRAFRLRANSFAPCARADCPCEASWNGRSGQFCCLTCRDGTPCARNYHRKPFVQSGAACVPCARVVDEVLEARSVPLPSRLGNVMAVLLVLLAAVLGCLVEVWPYDFVIGVVLVCAVAVAWAAGYCASLVAK